MSTQTVYQQEVHVFSTKKEFSRWQNYMLKRFHPRSIFIDVVGGIWFTYFFWRHDWVSAFVSILVARALCFLLATNYNTKGLAETFLGKLALLHLNPINVVTQLAGLVLFCVGLWQHSTESILAGVSVVLIGHIFGWEKVDRRLA